MRPFSSSFRAGDQELQAAGPGMSGQEFAGEAWAALEERLRQLARLIKERVIQPRRAQQFRPTQWISNVSGRDQGVDQANSRAI